MCTITMVLDAYNATCVAMCSLEGGCARLALSHYFVLTLINTILNLATQKPSLCKPCNIETRSHPVT